MSIIPRVNPGAVSPIAPLPGVRNDTRVQAVTGLADAVGGLARTGQQLYQQHQDRQDLAVILQARRDLSNWEATTFDPGNPHGIQAFKGGNALGANEALMPDLDKEISAIQTKLTPGQRAKFDSVAGSFRESIQGRLNTWMGAEHEQFLQADRKASIGNVVNDAVNIGMQGDDATARARLHEALVMQAAADKSDNMSDAVITYNQRSILSGYHARVIDSLMATDALTARDYVNQYGRDLLPADRLEVERKLGPLVDDGRGEGVFLHALRGGAGSDDRDFNAPGDGKAAPAVPPKIKATIVAAADKYGVPHNIALAMAEQESGFDPKAVGPETQYGRARGLYQFIPATASSLGIDPHNPEQSADATMRALSEQAKAKGWDWAIAAHYAGTDPKQHGPKTRQYVEEVRQKARRYGGGAASPDAPLSPAMDEAEVYARIAQERDPTIRRIAQQKAGEYFRIRSLRREQAERETVLAINDAIETAPIGQSVKQTLTPDQFAWARANGALERLEARRLQRIEGTLVHDDPRLVERLTYSMVNNPSAFAKVPLSNYAGQLSADTLKRLTEQQQQIDKPGKAQQFATEAQLLSLATDDMGLQGEDNAEQRNEFSKAYFTEKRTAMERNGGKALSADEMQTIINRLKLPFVKGGFLGIGGGKRRAFQGPAEGYHVPDKDRARIVAAYQAAGRTPTEQDIVDYYFEAAGSTL